MFDTAPTLRVGYACDQRCVGCDVPAEAHADPAPHPAELAAELDRLVARRAPAVVLSGGEPLLERALVLALAARARAGGVAVALETNGTHLDADTARALAAAGVARVYLNLPSFVPAQHDALAGAAGAGAAALAALAALREAQLPTWIDLLVSSANVRTVAATVRTAAERHAWIEGVRVTGVAPRGRARGAVLLPDLGELGAQLDRAAAFAERGGVRLHVRTGSLPACVALRVGDSPAPAAASAEAAYGPPCRRCALRPACPGAWHAVWDVQGGRGLAPPEALVEPWEPSEPPPRLQSVVRAHGRSAEAVRHALVAAHTPTRWLWTHHLAAADLDLPFTHLALELHGNALPAEVLLLARRAQRPVHVALRLPAEPFDLGPLVHALELAGVATVALLAGEGWVGEELALREASPTLDVRRVPPRPG